MTDDELKEVEQLKNEVLQEAGLTPIHATDDNNLLDNLRSSVIAEFNPCTQ